MKNINKKFGRFAISDKQIQKVQGGLYCNCNYYFNCPRGGGNYIEQPTGCQEVCCG